MSVLSRVLEAGGLTTTTLVLVKEYAEKAKPPRALFVPFYFGFALGKAGDADFQHRVIAAAFDLLQCSSGPVLAEFPEEGGPDSLPQSSEVHASPMSGQSNPADEMTALREFYERWVDAHSGRTAVGLCGVPQQRFHEVIQFLEACARGDSADLPERPSDVAVPEYIRYCVDDLKAFYYEARMTQHPDHSEPELHRWFWGETGLGALIVSVADRIKATDDADATLVAFGIAR